MKRKIANLILKETVTFIKTTQTGGAVSDLEIALLQGGGRPLHYHTSYTKTFTALDGELGLELKKRQKVILKPGESYKAKAGEVHRFFNAGNTEIKFRNEVHPGHEGFENTWRILNE